MLAGVDVLCIGLQLYWNVLVLYWNVLVLYW